MRSGQHRHQMPSGDLLPKQGHTRARFYFQSIPYPEHWSPRAAVCSPSPLLSLPQRTAFQLRANLRQRLRLICRLNFWRALPLVRTLGREFDEAPYKDPFVFLLIHRSLTYQYFFSYFQLNVGEFPSRTHKCGQLNQTNVGEYVVLTGWAQNIRYYHPFYTTNQLVTPAHKSKAPYNGRPRKTNIPLSPPHLWIRIESSRTNWSSSH